MTPDGIISSLLGPWFGKEGDWGVYLNSGIEYPLRKINDGRSPDERYYLYRDSIYTLSYGIIGGYKATIGIPLDPILKALMHICQVYK
ncbi:hypothetical protein L873DRAFT_91216 [Choiromyces venosus 120613-1]|uniref:DDE Tnp4 domain-containing protein n=1 Tax=Choiromyces venosus 120613-1 TaxID=1336337 RepID=A0A3N4JZ85_9PEZI|nr:hypothetical protein L873DRAFT_91216 [Choiromyces venosus 120613-1]